MKASATESSTIESATTDTMRVELKEVPRVYQKSIEANLRVSRIDKSGKIKIKAGQ
jgi:hypothetical protein